jgi:cell shape-determining protein MreC
MNSSQSYFLISLLLITALIAIISLLILATDQPDSFIEGKHRIAFPMHKITSTTEKIIKMFDNSTKSLQNENDGQNAKNELKIKNFTNSNNSSLKDEKNLLNEFLLEKLSEFGPANGESKFMGLSLILDNEWNERLLLAKADGKIELRSLDTKFNNFFKLF